MGSTHGEGGEYIGDVMNVTLMIGATHHNSHEIGAMGLHIVTVVMVGAFPGQTSLTKLD